MKSLALIATASLLCGGVANAAPCKDAKGKFTKCSPAAAKSTAAASNITKDAKGKCHIASGLKKGQFTKCP